MAERWARYKPRPTPVHAAQYDGTVDCADSLIRRVKGATGQELYFENDVRLVFHSTQDGTFDLFEDWWLVQDIHGKFEVMAPEDFQTTYEKMKEQ